MHSIKDVTHFAPLFAEENDLMMDFSNIISDELFVICSALLGGIIQT